MKLGSSALKRNAATSATEIARCGMFHCGTPRVRQCGFRRRLPLFTSLSLARVPSRLVETLSKNKKQFCPKQTLSRCGLAHPVVLGVWSLSTALIDIRYTDT